MKKVTKKTAKKAGTSISKEEALKCLGARIRQLRIEKGYTNYEHFAFDNDISRAQYGRYEKGEDIRFGTLIKVINGFGMSIEEFFSEGFDAS